MNFDYFNEEFNAAINGLESVLNSYEPISDYQLMFEADDPQVQQKIDNNAQKEQAGNNFLIKSCEAIKKLIHTIIAKIKNFFQTLTMSKEERVKYEDFLRRCKSDPQLKNKKITLTDYRKLNAEYDALIKEAETAISNMKEGQPNACDQLIEKIKNACKGVGKASTIIVTADVLDKFAASNREAAELIAKKLNEDENAIKLLESQIGKKGAADYKKRMNFCASKNKVMNKIVELRYKQYGNLQNCITQTFNELRGLISGDPKYAREHDPNADANNKWYKKKETTAAFTNSSVGVLGKVSGNDTVRQIAKDFSGNLGRMVAHNAASDASATLKQKFGIDRNSRYQRLMKNKPNIENFSSRSDYNKAMQIWNSKVDNLVASDKNAIDKKYIKSAKKYAEQQKGRTKNIIDFVTGNKKEQN